MCLKFLVESHLESTRAKVHKNWLQIEYPEDGKIEWLFIERDDEGPTVDRRGWRPPRKISGAQQREQPQHEVQKPPWGNMRSTRNNL
jgi:hypothetical protein